MDNIKRQVQEDLFDDFCCGADVKLVRDQLLVIDRVWTLLAKTRLEWLLAEQRKANEEGRR